MPRRLIEIGDGSLFLSGNGQGLNDLEKDPVAISNRPDSFHESGFDTAHLSRYEGTDFVQWYGRKADGCFHPWGKIMQIVAV